MISTIRSSVGQIFIKLFLLFIVLSFAVWGIGDIFRGSTDRVVAKAGSHTISDQEFSNYVRLQLQQRFGNRLTAEQLKQMGFHQMLLGEMIRNSLLSQEIERLGMGVSDRTLVKITRQMPIFKNKEGKFDKQLFQSILTKEGLSEASYFALVREQAMLGMLLGSLSPENIAVAPLTEQLYALRNETRQADILTIASNQNIAVPEPTEKELEAFWKNRKQQFATPEYRQISYIAFNDSAVAAKGQVSEEALRQEYEARKDSYQQPEKRDISNMLFATKKTAETAYKRLQAGEEFAAVAKAMLNQDEKATHLGLVAVTELVDGIGPEVFKLKQGEVSKPLKSSFGWHIMRVNDIQTAEVAPFEQVKEALRQELQKKQHDEAFYQLSIDIEDELASGSTLEEVAKKYGLKIEKTVAFTREGIDEAGQPVKFPAAFPNLAEMAFNNEEGIPSAVELSKDYSTYLSLRVDKVTATKIPELAAVKAAVLQAWKAEKKTSLLDAIAKKALERLRKGEAVGSVAASVGGKVQLGVMVEHSTASYPEQVITGLFSAEKDKPALLATDQDGNHYLAIVREIIPAPRMKEGEGMQLKTEVQQGIKEDIRQQYLQAIEKRYPVEVHEKVLERVL